MTATDKLCRLLDERGVEWGQVEGEVDRVTEWNTKGGYAQFYGSKTSSDDFLLVVHYHLTPEQVVAATLGPCNDSCSCTDGERTDLAAENAALREQAARLFDTACKHVADLQGVLTENAALQEQMERLLTLLRNDCDIDASWDGLRRFWSIGLTEGGCLMRDRACKAEAENAKLRAMRDTWAENDAKLRELVRDLWLQLLNAYDRKEVDEFADRMHELGIGASADA